MDVEWRANWHQAVQFLDIRILKSDAAPSPIGLRTVAMDEDLATKFGIPKGRATLGMRIDNCLSFLVGNQSSLVPALGIVRAGIADAQREVKLALGVLAADEIGAFWSRTVSFTDLRWLRVASQRNAVMFHQSFAIEQLQLTLRFEDLDARFGEIGGDK